MGKPTRKPSEWESRTCVRGCVHHSSLSVSACLGFQVRSSAIAKTLITKLRQIFRTYLHQEYKAGCPRRGSRRVVRPHDPGTHDHLLLDIQIFNN